MKYQVNVVKKVAFLIMTMALAVAMVACSGAAGTPGPAGPAGPPGTDAPTPDPTDPTDPTTPTEPTGPSGAAPAVTTPFTDVYLALEGTGKAPSKTIALDTHITDSDSRLKFAASSSDVTIAKLGAMTVNSRSVTITAVKVGPVTITVEARDGDNPPLTAQFSVTVVRDNARPTTNDLSQLDRTELQKVLYVTDGARTDTVTVVAKAGGTSSEPVEDSIASFKVAYGAKKESTSKYVTVGVATGTTKNQYVITVTPKEASLGMGSEKIMIYPKDMFGAESSEAWEFSAMFNRPPETLTDSLGTIRLERPDPVVTAASPRAYTAPTHDSVKMIKISDYFDSASLERMGVSNVGNLNDLNDATTAAATAAPLLAVIDKVGDTVCEVTYSTSLAVVQLLNEAGAIIGDVAAGTAPPELGSTRVLTTSPQALGAIRIDSRFSSLGDKLVTPGTEDPPTTAETPTVDTVAKKEGAFDIAIRCTDKDATAEVTGTVVVQQG